MCINFRNTLTITMIFLSINGTMCIRNLYLFVPDSAYYRGRTELRCLFEMEINEMLYSVKWYRGSTEFCRFQPRDVPPFRVFNNIPGINVVSADSNAQRIVLNPVTEVANGWFTCEISADAPSFQTHQMSAYMNVIEKPTEGPYLRVLRDDYKLGSTVKAECVIYNSLPAANMTYFINDDIAHPQLVWRRVERNGTSDLGPLWDSYITLKFKIQRRHVIDDRINLRCAAHIYSLYAMSSGRSLLVDMPLTTTTPTPPMTTTPRYTWWRPRERDDRKLFRPTLKAKTNGSNIIPGAVSTMQLLVCLVAVLLPTITSQIYQVN